jgi:protein PhnA
MSVKDDLMVRSNGVCELCGSAEDLQVYEVPPSDGSAEQSILVCSTCLEQIEDPEKVDTNHWRCLNECMWSEVPAVKVVAYRMLKRLGEQDLLEMLYLEPEVQEWADAEPDSQSEEKVVVKDSNGTTLEAGDSVTIIKDLEVKGAGFTAKRGTVVKNISLNGIEGQIEGRVNGTRIVLLSKFLKKV